MDWSEKLQIWNREQLTKISAILKNKNMQVKNFSEDCLEIDMGICIRPVELGELEGLEKPENWIPAIIVPDDFVDDDNFDNYLKNVMVILVNHGIEFRVYFPDIKS
jgi:hypothetical protein